MSTPFDINKELVRVYPQLFAFAMSICRNHHAAEDEVHDAIELALKHAGSFAAGTNFDAWIFTILRNSHRSKYRKTRRMVEDVDDQIAKTLSYKDDPCDRLIARETLQNVDLLPPQFRDPLVAVAVDELDYADAAQLLLLSVGTVKSRVNRARSILSGVEY